MNIDIIRYHYLIRIIGVVTMLGLIKFSDYKQNMYIIVGLAVFYILYNTAARFSLFIFLQRMENLTLDDTIERADIALYNGKNNGKNCISLNEYKLHS